MKNLPRLVYPLLVISICYSWSFSRLKAQEVIPAKDLQQDFDILQKALKTLHPGLYRYRDSLAMELYFDQLQTRLNQELDRKQAYRYISQFLAEIQCGHTYANFWNQPKAVQEELFLLPDKLPFTFRIIDRRMVVKEDATQENVLPPVTEILEINDVPVSVILDSLMTVIKSDGANDGNRLKALEVEGYGEFEAFDIYFPLFFGPNAENNTYSLAIQTIYDDEPEVVTVQAITREQRKAILSKRNVPIPDTYDELWEFKLLNDQLAYLYLGTFVTWKMEMDWKKFLKGVFKRIRQNQVAHLILDIRGNEGGMLEVAEEVTRYLIQNPIAVESYKSLLRYEQIPDELDPYLSTWDDSFKDRRGKVNYLGDGFYALKEKSGTQTISPYSKPFTGKTYLVIDPANSSATFIMAQLYKKYDIATLVGQETGGNLMGTNGGQLFFLTLPHSQIEVDIPLIGYYPHTAQPNRGLMPDRSVTTTLEDVIKGIDKDLGAATKLIGEEE